MDMTGSLKWWSCRGTESLIWCPKVGYGRGRLDSQQPIDDEDIVIQRRQCRARAYVAWGHVNGQAISSKKASNADESRLQRSLEILH
jgi:hypothetical protein